MFIIYLVGLYVGVRGDWSREFSSLMLDKDSKGGYKECVSCLQKHLHDRVAQLVEHRTLMVGVSR